MPQPNAPTPSPARRRPRTAAWRALALLLAVVLTFAVVEIALRAAGFGYRLSAVPDIPDATDRPAAGKLFVPDRDLLWVHHKYDAAAARAVDMHPPIVFMGDSCTHWGSYHVFLMDYIAQRHAGGRRVLWSNFGVAGWSTRQGLAQVQRDVSRIRPKVVTVYYG